MKNLISHRGNINGKIPEKENSPEYVFNALQQGYHCEIDVWYSSKNGWWLGHDSPQYSIDYSFLESSHRFWIHAKNIEALCELNKNQMHVFWHQEDDYTLTSEGYIWAYPGKNVPAGNQSIAVLPEIYPKLDLKDFKGICSDYIERYI